jgi:hypothetical protein
MVRTGSMLLAVVVLILSLSLVAMADNDTLVIGSGAEAIGLDPRQIKIV